MVGLFIVKTLFKPKLSRIIPSSNSNSTMEKQQLQQALDKVNETFRENDSDLYAEYSISQDIVYINIEWGDWKHEHCYADYVMESNGFTKIGEELIMEDGEDCYSSTHYYVPNED